MSELVTLIGSNNGQLVNVTDHALDVYPQTEFEAAVAAGLAFSWSALGQDMDATDTILLVENNSTAYDLHVQQIMVATDNSSQFIVHTSSGVTPTAGALGVAVTGVNLNRNSALVAPATALSDDDGNGQAAATYSGRLLIGTLLAAKGITIDLNGTIILPYDHCIGIDITTAPTALCNATIIGYFKARA